MRLDDLGQNGHAAPAADEWTDVSLRVSAVLWWIAWAIGSLALGAWWGFPQ